MVEGEHIDKKSLSKITKKNPDRDELAKDCVCFANAIGGKILIGIEDGKSQPPQNQTVSEDLPRHVLKVIQGRTINVSVLPTIQQAENGGQYLELTIQRSAVNIASTSSGKYYIRVDDDCKPVLPDELSRLLNDRQAFVWETGTHLKVPVSNYDPDKLNSFLTAVHNSDRITTFIKEKSKQELLDYYFFSDGTYLSNLGILWIGKRQDRVRLLYAPSIQFLKWDENENRIKKEVWDDYSLNPAELIQDVWNLIPEWKEGIEISDGIFRTTVYNYDETVIRELLANALVHRPYTIRGDIFINLYPDKIEIHNPGLLPLGVTPRNILHKSVQRNPLLAKVFYDLKLMEKEGSGYDRIYETLLSQGKPPPEPKEQNDRVIVTVSNRITDKKIIRFINKANERYQLRSKELISLGLIAQHNGLTSIEFSDLLGLESDESIRNWIGRLAKWNLIKTRGRTKGTTYYVDPDVLKKLDFKGLTNLKNIEPHRLQQLIIEDLKRYSPSSIGEIHERIGLEIPRRKLRHQLKKLSDEGVVSKTGERKHTVYSIDK